MQMEANDFTSLDLGVHLDKLFGFAISVYFFLKYFLSHCLGSASEFMVHYGHRKDFKRSVFRHGNIQPNMHFSISN